MEQDLDIPKNAGITVLRTGGNKGPSFARNVGLGIAQSNWIAFLDDDDYWLPNHIESLLNFCETNKLDAAYSSAKVSGKIRPKKIYDGTISPLKAVYEKVNWNRTQYYFPTPGLIISREVVAHLPFNENMFEREDLWFAHKIFEYQFRLAQSTEASLVVNQNAIRSINRTNLEADLDWAQRLELVDSVARDNFLMGVAFRNAVIRIDWYGMREISKKYRDHHWIYRLIASL
jgi:glycosyltransferase involved in cell wall biosynthesis